MPIDPNLIPALEQELVFAKQVYPGGQPPNEGRIAAIEEQLAIHRAYAEGNPPAEELPENVSDVPTDYSADPDEVLADRESKPSKAKAAREAAKAAKETADATRAEDEEVETTDA